MFVESVLRFGLPVNFQGMVLLPPRKQVRHTLHYLEEDVSSNGVLNHVLCVQVKKLREALNELYFHLDSAAGIGGGGGEDLPTGLAGFGQV